MSTVNTPLNGTLVATGSTGPAVSASYTITGQRQIVFDLQAGLIRAQDFNGHWSEVEYTTIGTVTAVVSGFNTKITVS